MNDMLQKQLSQLESLIAIQKECVIAGYPETNYMHGMLNGLICAHSVFTGDSPKYHSKPHRRRPKNIRHKVARGPKVKNK
jgi:hypothetical protein